MLILPTAQQAGKMLSEIWWHAL